MILAIIPDNAKWAGVTLGPVILVKKRHRWNAELIQHEMIHVRQQMEMLIVFFYVWYLVEFLVRLIQKRGKWMEAYKRISFEREANHFEGLPRYPALRENYAWINYL